MTSYEIVLKNVTFDNPERIAIKYPTLGKGDILRLFLQSPRAYRPAGETADMTKKAVPIPGEVDEWGILWQNKGNSGLGLGPVSYTHLSFDWNRIFHTGRFASGLFLPFKEAWDQESAAFKK